MKAAQLVAPQQFQIIDVPVPNLAAAGNGAVLIRVERACICGSDMPHFLRILDRYPAAIGLSIHECIGTVVESKSSRFKPGDAVLSVPPGQLGLAEYFVGTEASTVHLPPGGFNSEVLMAQPLGTVMWAFRKLGNLIHADTVVLGQGPMGLLIDSVLSNLGAKTVIGIDRIPERLAAAERMRATHVVDATREDPVRRVAEITGGRMADLIVEAVGHQTGTLNLCMPHIKNGGTILAFGVPDDDIYPIHFREFYHRNLRLIGSVSPEPLRDYPLAIDMIVQGRIDVSPLLTHEIPFDDVQYGFELFTQRKDGAIKVILRY
ncbi:zinc-binding dehydrogenase [Candidatus Poribacteria bacterium]|nr:zinc-binding dehydrogenase [Candidatus Poribacteria bacterium]